MIKSMTKSSTDIFWNERPQTGIDPKRVNIDDLVQRKLEADFVLKHLNKEDEALEVGCGNGFFSSALREHVKHLDSFDYAENMIEQAKEVYREKNNTFFHDNLLEPKEQNKSYDVVICVRVLINLSDFQQQETAFENLISFVKPGGKLILIEGFSEGFEKLNSLRTSSGIPTLSPAPINYYSSCKDFVELFSENLSILDTMHTGSFDYLTRVIYPALVGSENASGPSDFHEKILEVARAYNPDEFACLARLKGWVLKKD